MKSTVEIKNDLRNSETEAEERISSIEEFFDRMLKAQYEEMIMCFDIFG